MYIKFSYQWTIVSISAYNWYNYTWLVYESLCWWHSSCQWLSIVYSQFVCLRVCVDGCILSVLSTYLVLHSVMSTSWMELHCLKCHIQSGEPRYSVSHMSLAPCGLIFWPSVIGGNCTTVVILYCWLFGVVLNLCIFLLGGASVFMATEHFTR